MNFEPLGNVALIVTAAVYGLLAAIAMRAGLFGIWLGIILILSLWRYCYVVLRHVAQGRSNIPPPDLESMNPIAELVLILHFLAFPGAVIVATGYQPLGWVLGIAAILLFPASAALMGMTSNIASALNPAALSAFIQALGRDYFLLVFACVALTSAVAALDVLVLSRLGILSFVVSMMLEVWALIGVFALIGSVLHAHRTEFNIPGVRRSEDDWDATERERGWRAALDRAYGSIRSGLLESGYAIIRELMDDNANSYEVQYWLVENMLDWEDKRHALDLARKIVLRHVDDGTLESGLELYQRCSRLDPGFALPAPAATALAAHADSLGRRGLASELRALGRAAPVSPGL